jgi:hypothetical protein
MGLLELDFKVALLSAIIGGIIGYISFIVNNPLLNLIIMIIFLLITSGIVKFISKTKQEKGWWFSNVIIVFIFMWFIVWTIFFNTKIIV